jgi:hypothetical protein
MAVWCVPSPISNSKVARIATSRSVDGQAATHGRALMHLSQLGPSLREQPANDPGCNLQLIRKQVRRPLRRRTWILLQVRYRRGCRLDALDLGTRLAQVVSAPSNLVRDEPARPRDGGYPNYPASE